MQLLMFVLFVVIFSVDHLAKIQVVGGEVTLIADFLSFVATIVVVGCIWRNQSIALSFKYVVIIAVAAVHLVNGIVINAVPSGALVAGIKLYCKYLPFFLLPLVYPFSERQISGQLRFLLFLCILQLPVAVFQRFFMYSDLGTGDVVMGTLAASSFLSIVLICAIAVLTSFYIKRLITLPVFLMLLFLLFIPTTINETKGTLVLLPIALFVPLLLSNRSGPERRKQTFAFLMVGGLLFGGFVTAYNAFYGHRYAAEEGEEGSIITFLTDPKMIVRYLAPRTSGIITKEKGEEGPVGRVDQMVVAFDYLSYDPIQLFVGLGMGRITRSPVEDLSGDLDALAADIGARTGDTLGWQTAATEVESRVAVVHLLWETGIVGVLLLYLFLYMLFRDARALSTRDDLDGALGLAWCAIVPIVAIAYVYKDVLPVNGIMYPFWYFSGYVIAQRVRHSIASAPTLRTAPILRRRTQWTPASAGSSRTFKDLSPRLDPRF
jgi:hypothetical protein